MFQYINSVLDAHQSTLVPDVPVESPSTEDPSSPVELCLQVGSIIFLMFVTGSLQSSHCPFSRTDAEIFLLYVRGPSSK